MKGLILKHIKHKCPLRFVFYRLKRLKASIRTNCAELLNVFGRTITLVTKKQC